MKIDCITHAGPGRGLGHLMRLVALAEALVELGLSVRFILPDSNGTEALKVRGLRWCIVSDQNWRKPGLDTPDLFVIDHYEVSTAYFNTFMASAPVMYIDDLCLEGFPVSAVLNGHFYGEELPYETLYAGSLKLLGPRFCLLRHEYRRSRRGLPWPITDILVSTGGTDPQGKMPQLVEELIEGIGNRKMRIHCIIGSGFQEESTLAEMTLRDSRILLYRHPGSLADIMARCQLAVTAAGTTLYELGALGVPAFAWQMVDNQKYVYASAKRQGLIFSFDPEIAGDLGTAVRSVLTKEESVRSLSEKLKSTLDGMGSSRAAKEIVKFLEGRGENK